RQTCAPFKLRYHGSRGIPRTYYGQLGQNGNLIREGLPTNRPEAVRRGMFDNESTSPLLQLYAARALCCMRSAASPSASRSRFRRFSKSSFCARVLIDTNAKNVGEGIPALT